MSRLIRLHDDTKRIIDTGMLEDVRTIIIQKEENNNWIDVERITDVMDTTYLNRSLCIHHIEKGIIQEILIIL